MKQSRVTKIVNMNVKWHRKRLAQNWITNFAFLSIGLGAKWGKPVLICDIIFQGCLKYKNKLKNWRDLHSTTQKQKNGSLGPNLNDVTHGVREVKRMGLNKRLVNKKFLGLINLCLAFRCHLNNGQNVQSIVAQESIPHMQFLPFLCFVQLFCDKRLRKSWANVEWRNRFFFNTDISMTFAKRQWYDKGGC